MDNLHHDDPFGNLIGFRSRYNESRSHPPRSSRDVPARVRSVRAADSYIPLGPSTRAVLVTEDQIVQGALDLAREQSGLEWQRLRARS